MALLLTICHPRVARRKYTPDTACQPEPREVCGPDGFQMVAGPVQCYNQTKTIVVDTPVEECELEPQQSCGHTTKQVPKLIEVEVSDQDAPRNPVIVRLLRSVSMSPRRSAPGAGATPRRCGGQ